jgi:hypothetical protein
VIGLTNLIIVEGLPCSGKSTTAKYIADRLNAKYFDEGSGIHPADYEFHAFINNKSFNNFSIEEQAQIKQNAVKKANGYVVSLSAFSGELFDKLLQYKIYDFLPWETEYPLMLDKWSEFVQVVASDERYVFNCVFLQNPMCETMMRFGFDTGQSFAYISQIFHIIKPLNPVVIYLHSDNIQKAIEKALPERSEDWLNGVIDYHCNGAYGKANQLCGFNGYISALEERQRRELEILQRLRIPYTIIHEPQENWECAYLQINKALER